MFERIQQSVHDHDAIYKFEKQVVVANEDQKRISEFRQGLEEERVKKEKAIKVEQAREILGGDEFSYRDWTE